MLSWQGNLNSPWDDLTQRKVQDESSKEGEKGSLGWKMNRNSK